MKYASFQRDTGHVYLTGCVCCESTSGLILYNACKGYDNKAKCSLQARCVLQQFHLILHTAFSVPYGLVLSVHFLQIL